MNLCSLPLVSSKIVTVLGIVLLFLLLALLAYLIQHHLL